MVRQEQGNPEVKDVLSRGAEAVLYLEQDRVVKDRVRKGYRIPELDTEIRRLRTRVEAGLLLKAARAGVRVPGLIGQQGHTLVLERLPGQRLKEAFAHLTEHQQGSVCTQIGAMAGKLHAAGIVHGDLTTSNMILLPDGTVGLIDFGLGKTSTRIEDRAMDLFLLLEAFRAAHTYLKGAPQYITAAYRAFPEAETVLRQLEAIRQRRRYKGHAYDATEARRD